jgi:hypothetical protein
VVASPYATPNNYAYVSPSATTSAETMSTENDTEPGGRSERTISLEHNPVSAQGNARGSFFAGAEVSDHVRPGVVASTKGQWPRDSKQCATVNATVDERDSDMGGGAVYHDNRVRVDKSSGSDALSHSEIR